MTHTFACYAIKLNDGLTLWSDHRDWSRGTSASHAQPVAELKGTLAPAIAALEASKRETMTAVEASARVYMPLAAVGSIVGSGIIWALAKDLAWIFGLIAFLFVAAARASTHEPAQAYRRQFKDSVVPTVLERFGAFRYVIVPTIRAGQLSGSKLLPANAKLHVEDEITGTYRGLEVRAAELRATATDSDNNEETVFDGQIIDIALPRPLSGTTILVPKGDLGDGAPSGLDRVDLENPELMAQFDVFSSDQVSARVLFSPAYQQRILALNVPSPDRRSSTKSVSHHLVNFVLASSADAFRKRFDELPGTSTRAQVASKMARGGLKMLAEDGRILIAVPKTEKIDYFEPPPYHKDVDAEAMLGHILGDMQVVLGFADAVLDLDYRTAAVSKPQAIFAAA